MKKVILILVVLALLLCTGCINKVSDDVDTEPFGIFHYYYDEVHDVSIWTWSEGYRGGMAVLPGKDVNNRLEPMKLGEGR